MRRAGLVIGVIAVVALLVLAAAGIDLWTDAIWFKSVGFDSVFWTRIGAQVGLFIAAGVVALIVLLGNLLIANRLVPPPDPARPGQLRAVAGRLADAQRQAERNARLRAAGGSFGAFGGPGGRPNAGGVSLTFDGDEIPDLVPIGTWVIAVFAVLIALGVAGAVSGAWETLLLWVNRVPYSATSTVTDPVFNKDIGFYLFELPFFRLVQSLVNGLLLASLAVAGARYLLAVTRGGEVFVTRVRVHLAVLGRPLPDLRGGRLPARQVRARLQQRGRRDGRGVHRRQRPVPGLRRADVPVRDCRCLPGRGRVHALDVAAGRRRSSSGSRASIVAGTALSRGDPALSASTRTSTPRSSRTSPTTST